VVVASDFAGGGRARVTQARVDPVAPRLLLRRSLLLTSLLMSRSRGAEVGVAGTMSLARRRMRTRAALSKCTDCVGP